MSAYLDASMIVPLFIADAFSEQADALIAQESMITIADWAVVEVSSVIARQKRIGAIDTQTAQRVLSQFDSWRARAVSRAETLSSDMVLATEFVRKFDLGLRGPDALHLAIANRLGMRLLTFDTRMKSAAIALGLDVA
jgi:uncharacterized protein